MGKGKILSNAPCYVDLFEGKAHERLAKVIAEEIANDENCTIIGIDGGWGAGKSNLVGMVKKNLTDEVVNSAFKGKYYFFTYDVWGHQNDLPRRSILEELTSEITHGDNALLNEFIWKERLDNLLAKKKKTFTKTVPSLNYAIVIIALMTAFTPAVNAISDKPQFRKHPKVSAQSIISCLDRNDRIQAGIRFPEFLNEYRPQSSQVMPNKFV